MTILGTLVGVAVPVFFLGYLLKQVFAVVVHSGVVISVAQVFGLPLAYARETMSGATNLAVFLPFLDENSFPARFLGAIDLFQHRREVIDQAGQQVRFAVGQLDPDELRPPSDLH